MARGAAEFDDLFPGLLDDMVAAGVPMLDNRPDHMHFAGAGRADRPAHYGRMVDQSRNAEPYPVSAVRSKSGSR